MFFGGGRVVAFSILLVVLGTGLAINSLRGLASREGMYDEASTQSMTISSWLGGLLGIALAAVGGWVLLHYLGWLF